MHPTMLVRFFIVSALLLVPICVFAQDVTPPPDDIVKISTTLIQIDVTVTDKNGKPVTDLKKDEVEIYENGRRQDITNFSFVSSASPQPLQKAEAGSVPIPEHSSNGPGRRVSRTIALVVDDLTMSFVSMYYVRRALNKFVDEQMQDGDLVAIIRTGGGMGALQQFTTNKEQLRAAIDKIQFTFIPYSKLGAFTPLMVKEPDDNDPAKATAKDKGSGSKDRDYDDEDLDDLRGDFFTAGTLGALNYVVRGMRELPGRKSVLLMSDGLQLPRFFDDDPLRGSMILEAVRRLVDQANRSAVVIYSVDARGLLTGAITAADAVSGASAASFPLNVARIKQIFETQEGLSMVARLTGGKSFLNTNDLGAGIRKMLDDQSYYLVGYEPDGEFFDPDKRRFNDLEVKVKRKDVVVRYRSGFFGEKDGERKSELEGLSDSQKIVAALASPLVVNDLHLSLETVPRQDSEGKITLMSLLHLNLKDLKFTEEKDGNLTGSFEILGVNFGDNGFPLETYHNGFAMTVKPENLAALNEQGIVYSFEMPVKKPGAYLMRVAVRDLATQKVGSAVRFVQIPKLKKDNVVLSGIILDDVTAVEWERGSQANNASAPAPASDARSPLADTAIRRFRKGTILKYSLEAYRKKGKAGDGTVLMRARLVHGDKILFEGEDAAAMPLPGGDGTTTPIAGALAIPDGLEPGDYALQVIVTLQRAKKKPRVTSRFVQFEIVD